jgi:hypothetical protein
MQNPARPSFGDVIDEGWGDLTADRVVRRYATTAERDLDLTGIDPADLAGQVVTITAPGGYPYEQVHDGTRWWDMGYGPGAFKWGGHNVGGAPPAGIPMKAFEGSVVRNMANGLWVLDLAALGFAFAYGYSHMATPGDIVGGRPVVAVSSGTWSNLSSASWNIYYSSDNAAPANGVGVRLQVRIIGA